MKTRTDFVSNSSSCSFVISLPAGNSFDDFVALTAAGCLKHIGPNEQPFGQRQDELNKAVLNYHLRASELLFLGSLRVSNVVREFRRQEDQREFESVKRDISSGYIGGDGDTEVVSNGDDAVVIKFADWVEGIAVKSSNMPYITGKYLWRDDYDSDYSSDDPAAQAAAEKISEFAAIYSDNYRIDYTAKSNSDTYFVSRATVWNTRALIAAGKNLVLDKWMDLDKLDEMLKGGTRIFRIRVNNGGDGVDEDALFTFGGWDGEDLFDGIDGISFLDSETM